MRNNSAYNKLQRNTSLALLLVGLLLFILRHFFILEDFFPIEYTSMVLDSVDKNSYSLIFHLSILVIIFLFLFQIQKGIETENPITIGLNWILFPMLLWRNNGFLFLFPLLAFLMLQIINKLKQINENEKDLTQAFVIGAFCGLSFFIEPSSIWFVPASVAGFFIVRSIHLKSLLAIITGLITSTLYIAIAYLFFEIKPDISSWISTMRPDHIGIPSAIIEKPYYFIAWSGLSVLVIFNGINHLSEKKIKLRTYYLLFINFFAFGLPALFYFSNANQSLWILECLFLCLAPLYWLTLENTKTYFSTIFFIIAPFLIEIRDWVNTYYSLF